MSFIRDGSISTILLSYIYMQLIAISIPTSSATFAFLACSEGIILFDNQEQFFNILPAKQERVQLEEAMARGA